MNERVTYKYGMDLRDVFRLVEEGCILTCPRCKADLTVALDMESAARQKVFPGLYCPANPKHVSVWLELAGPMRAMRELFAEMRTEREKNKEEML
jgi:hypothetical protein